MNRPSWLDEIKLGVAIFAIAVVLIGPVLIVAWGCP